LAGIRQVDDHLQQCLAAEARLGDESARRARVDQVAVVEPLPARDQDDEGRARFPGEHLGDREAVEVRELDVEQDDIGVEVADCDEGAGAVGRLPDDLEAPAISSRRASDRRVRGRQRSAPAVSRAEPGSHCRPAPRGQPCARPGVSPLVRVIRCANARVGQFPPFLEEVMSRTVCHGLDVFRVGAAGAVAVVLLSACGGGSSDSGASAATASAGQSEGGAKATDGLADFCSQAAGIDERVDSALSDAEGDPSLTDAFRQIAADLRAIEPPAAIASDWNATAAGLDRMADAFGQVDLTDLDSLEALDQAEGDLTEVSGNVDQYLADECGT